MNIKILCILLGCLVLKSATVDLEEDVDDFEFGSEESTDDNKDLDNFDNDVDYEDEKKDTKNSIFSKEEYVRKVILSSMKNPGMKEKVAKVLPILRVMTPNQKLALATLITTQVLSPPESKALTIEEVNIII